MFQNFFRKIGFTQAESGTILFLLATLLIGIIIDVIKENKNDDNLFQFDYAVEDSAFFGSSIIQETTDSLEKIIEKGVDSKRELLDFNGAKFAGNNLKNSGFPVEIIDINNASVGEFASLPGIGPKIASAIVEYRENFGKFKSIEDIKNVKGIGKAKFEKIRKFVVVK